MDQKQRKQTSEWGRKAEDFAVSLLQGKGYKIIDRNFHSRFGEIDIVAIDGDVLVFIEVKARWSREFGLPEEAVTYFKLKKIRKTAEYYSFLHPNLSQKLRVDVVALEIDRGEVMSSNVIHVDD